MTAPRVAFVVTHPIQYYSPWFAHLASVCDLTVFYAHRQTPEGQAAAGFATKFEWDLPLLDGYRHQFLENVSRRPGLQHFNGCDTPEIGKIIKNGGFDAVAMIGWNKKCFIQAGWAAYRAGTPLLIRLDSELRTPRSVLKRMIKRPVYRGLLPRAAHYLSPGVRSDDYLRHYGVRDGRIHRVPHMIDVARFSAAADAVRETGGAKALRAAHGVGPSDFVFLFVGKLIARKRVNLLIDARRKLQNPKAVIWLVGDGPLEAEIRDYALAQGVKIDFLGFVNQAQLPEIYAAADCLVLPSYKETWGLVVNEAQACGLPAIVSEECGCAPELIEDDVTGWVLRTAAADELATLMERAMSCATLLPAGAIGRRADASAYPVGTRRFLDAIDRASRLPHGLETARV